jgi:hypothetical protein
MVFKAVGTRGVFKGVTAIKDKNNVVKITSGKDKGIIAIDDTNLFKKVSKRRK